MNEFKRSFLLTLGLSLVILAAFFGGYTVREWQMRQLGQFAVLDETRGLLDQNAYFPVPTGSAMEYGAVHGLVNAFQQSSNDPHTNFFEPPQAELQSDQLQGKFGGIGVRLSNDAEGYYVLYPFADSPAKEAGIQDGDRLLAVDDLPITPQTPSDELTAAVRGPIGGRVTITIGRPPDFEPTPIQVKRAEISLPSVAFHLDADQPRLGVIEVNVIGSGTVKEILDAVADLQSRGAEKFALDLRNNGGGYLDSGIDVARLFLEDGVVLEQQARGEQAEIYEVEKRGALADLPLVVLINSGTASAAEIIAGALKAHGRAALIGETSYGKNTIQLVFDLSDRSSLHVTHAEWRIPGLDDEPRPGKGLPPDIPTASDAAIQAAIQYFFP